MRRVRTVRIPAPHEKDQTAADRTLRVRDELIDDEEMEEKGESENATGRDRQKKNDAVQSGNLRAGRPRPCPPFSSSTAHSANA
jgi:hypothetical protein